MAKLTLEGLRKLRAQAKSDRASSLSGEAPIEIIVGMGTSGIASGAPLTLTAFREEIAEQKLSNVVLRQTGSMGLDHAEPTVEVRVPGMPPVIYGKVDSETAKKIIRKHVLGGVLLNDRIYDRPSIDIQAE